uniref:CS domain-containing protein n=1 Tax=Globodera pallida TaxID=36090 RepID=A0A183CDH1_GLOPA
MGNPDGAQFGAWILRGESVAIQRRRAVRARFEWSAGPASMDPQVADCAAGSATDIQSIAVAPTVEVRARVLRVQQGRGAAGRRAAVSVEISLKERRHALTQRGVAGNMAGLQQRQDMRVEGLMVPGECRYEWEADGKEAVFPRRLRM